MAFEENGSMSRRVHPSFERLMHAFSQHAGVDERSAQAEIARRLKLSPQRVTNWKTRGVSKDGALELERQTGVAAKWVLDGVGPAKPEYALPHQPTPPQNNPPLSAALPAVLDAIRASPHKEELRVLLPLLVETDAPAYRARLLELLAGFDPRGPNLTPEDRALAARVTQAAQMAESFDVAGVMKNPVKTK